MKYNAYYPIRLVVEGTVIQLFFNGEGTAAVSLADSSLAGTYAGIRSYAAAAHTTYFDNFSAGAP